MMPPLDLEDPAVRADPYPTYRWYREQAPVHLLESSCQPGKIRRYLVTRWAEVEAGLKNPALKRALAPHALWNQPLAQVPPALQTYARVTREWPLFRDPPEHAPVRRPVNRVLEETRSATTQALVAEVLQRTLAELAGRASFDAVDDFARRVVTEVNLGMLGLDGAGIDWREFGAHLQSISLGLGNVFDSGRLETASAAMESLQRWISEAAARQRSGNGSARALFLERLLAQHPASEGDDPFQLTAMAILLLQAGQDTTSALLASALLSLLRHPKFKPQLGTDEGALAIVEEVLRYESPVQQITRHASEATKVGAVTVQAGEGVSFLLGAANRDPAVFAHPEVFDPRRAEPRTAAFGFGPHGCPGAAFGRNLVAQALRALFLRFPDLELVEETVAWKPLVTFRSLAALPVRTEKRGGGGNRTRG